MFIEHATNIFCKGSENKYFRLYKTVSVAAPQLCRGTMKVPEDNTQANGRGCVPIKLYLQKQVAGWIWHTGHSLPSSLLDLLVLFPYLLYFFISLSLSLCCILDKLFRYIFQFMNSLFKSVIYCLTYPLRVFFHWYRNIGFIKNNQ